MLMSYSNARPTSTGVVSSITFWISLPVKRTSANGVSSLARRPSTPSACWPRLRPWRAPLERPLGAQDHGSGRTCCQVERTIGKVHRASCVLRTLASAQVRRRSVPLRPCGGGLFRDNAAAAVDLCGGPRARLDGWTYFRAQDPIRRADRHSQACLDGRWSPRTARCLHANHAGNCEGAAIGIVLMKRR